MSGKAPKKSPGGIDIAIVIGAVILFAGAIVAGLLMLREYYAQSQCYSEKNPWCLKGYKCDDVVCSATCNVSALDTKPSTLDPCCVKKYPGLFTMPIWWYCMDPDVDYLNDPLCNKGYNFCDGITPCPTGYNCNLTTKKCEKV